MAGNSNALALFVGFGKVLSLFLGFLVPVLLVRLLDKSDYGLYSQFNMIFVSLATFFSFGIRSNLVYFYNKLEKKLVKVALTQTILVSLTLGAFAVCVLHIDYFQTYILGGDKDLLGYVFLLSLAIVFQMVSCITEVLYIVKRDRVVGFLYPSLSVLMKALLVLTLVYSFGTLQAAISGLVISLFILVIFNGIYLFSEYRRFPRGGFFDPNLLKLQISYSAPFGLSNSLKEIAAKFDKYMVLNLLNSSTYASYAVAFTTIPGVMAIYDSLAQVYLMDMVKRLKDRDIKSALEIYKDLVAKSLSFTIPLLVLFMYFADVIIPLVFTDKYKESVILFQIYMPTLLFVVLGADLAIRASGQTTLSLRAQTISLCLSLPLTYFLIGEFGVKGAALGAAIATILPLILITKYSMKILETDWLNFFPWRKIWQIVCITFFAFIPVFCLSFFLNKNVHIFMISTMVFGLIVFILQYRHDLLFIERSNVDNIAAKAYGFFR